MKNLIPLLILVGCNLQASVSVVQTVNSPVASCGAATGPSCTSGTLSAVGAGHLITVKTYNSAITGGINSTAISTAVCGGDTLTNLSTASLTNANGAFSFWYILSATGGATTCQLTLVLTNTGKGMVVEEWSSNLTSPTFTLDSGATPAGVSSSTCTNCTAPTLTIAGSNDIILDSLTGAVVSGVSSPFGTLTTFQVATNGRYATDNINTASGAPPTYTNSSATVFMNSVAITENGSGGGGGASHPVSAIVVGP